MILYWFRISGWGSYKRASGINSTDPAFKPNALVISPDEGHYPRWLVVKGLFGRRAYRVLDATRNRYSSLVDMWIWMPTADGQYHDLVLPVARCTLDEVPGISNI